MSYIAILNDSLQDGPKFAASVEVLYTGKNVSKEM